MNAKELLDIYGNNGPVATFLRPGAREVAERALRLLAAAEANDGTTPETDEFAEHDFVMETLRLHPMILERIKAWADFARTLEQQRNALAARVRELEQFQLERQSAEYLDAERYRYLRDRADENSDGPIICSGLGDNFDFLRGPECDEEIDAARSK